MAEFEITYKEKRTPDRVEALSRSSGNSINKYFEKTHTVTIECNNYKEMKKIWLEKAKEDNLEFFGYTDLSILDGVNTWSELK